MTDEQGLGQQLEDIVACDFSDEALETAAEAARGMAMSIGGPISVNVMCCGGD